MLLLGLASMSDCCLLIPACWSLLAACWLLLASHPRERGDPVAGCCLLLAGCCLPIADYWFRPVRL